MAKKPAPIFAIELQEWELTRVIDTLKASAAFLEQWTNLYAGDVNTLRHLAEKLEGFKRQG